MIYLSDHLCKKTIKHLIIGVVHVHTQSLLVLKKNAEFMTFVLDRLKSITHDSYLLFIAMKMARSLDNNQSAYITTVKIQHWGHSATLAWVIVMEGCFLFKPIIPFLGPQPSAKSHCVAVAGGRRLVAVTSRRSAVTSQKWRPPPACFLLFLESETFSFFGRRHHGLRQDGKGLRRSRSHFRRVRFLRQRLYVLT